jgi:5-amino-6-(5-phosphoribosylamino)uracil reductase
MKVTVAYAQTLDGRIATRTGDSQWIGGPESLRIAHQLRASHDAVLVGVGTVIADNPRLTTRLVEGPSPVRVIADSRLRLPLEASVLSDDAAPTLVATTQNAPERARQLVSKTRAEILMVRLGAQGGIDINDLMRVLAQRGLRSLLVEGGGRMITSVLKAGLCDRLVVCIAPRILGSGIDAVGDLGIERLRDALSFSRVRMTPCGEDLIVDGELATAASIAG